MFDAREQIHAGKPSGGDTANRSYKESTKGFRGGQKRSQAQSPKQFVVQKVHAECCLMKSPALVLNEMKASVISNSALLTGPLCKC